MPPDRRWKDRDHRWEDGDSKTRRLGYFWGIKKYVMKKYLTITCLAWMLLMAGSCRKDDGDQYGQAMGAPPVRKVRYELYTNQDFSKNQENIHFGLFMRTHDGSIFDSALAAMKISDIPDSLHRIIIEKLVPNCNPDTLIVGFNYVIDDVGVSSHQELFPAGDTLKVVRFSFD